MEHRRRRRCSFVTVNLWKIININKKDVQTEMNMYFTIRVQLLY